MMAIYDNIVLGNRLFEPLSSADTDARVQEALTGADLWEEVKDRLTKPAGGVPAR